MRLKGKLIRWNEDKTFGFIAPNGGGDHLFIHKTALSNRNSTPDVNDVITFSISKDKQGRYCADEATFSDEKLKNKQAKKVSKFSIYLLATFVSFITIAYHLEYIPQKLLLIYLGSSVITYFAYAVLIRRLVRCSRSSTSFKAQISKERVSKFFGFTVLVNLGGLAWIFTHAGLVFF